VISFAGPSDILPLECPEFQLSKHVEEFSIDIKSLPQQACLGLSFGGAPLEKGGAGGE
jgi:hypothetical protein